MPMKWSARLELGINFIDTADTYGNMPVFDRPGVPPAVETAIRPRRSLAVLCGAAGTRW